MTRTVALVMLLSATSIAIVSPLGCSRPAASSPGVVHGEATFQNRAMAGGLVVFVPNADRGCAGKMYTATIAANGQYQLAEGAKLVTPGWYRVALADPTDWCGSEWSLAFPTALRRPDLSGIEREVKPGQDHHFDFRIELTAR